ncbi:MAG: HDIG domain-containing protein [Spirochaetota bacterium]|nr:HDIG domain-containing protein [Spirochaetota bacterium]
MIERDKALELLKRYIKNENMIRHSLASESVLIALAKELGEDESRWGTAGLLHDIDVEITNADLNIHTKEAVNILRNQGIDEDIIEAIRMHNETAHPGEKRESLFHHALASGETITGLIVATALVYPDKKLASVKPKSITKRMKEKAFAKSVNRDAIMECEKLGLELNRFVEIALKAMQNISDRLGF